MHDPIDRPAPDNVDTAAAVPSSAPARRPWHAPQFIKSDVEMTENHIGATTDASPVQNS
jgi:hypothetical protein